LNIFKIKKDVVNILDEITTQLKFKIQILKKSKYLNLREVEITGCRKKSSFFWRQLLSPLIATDFYIK